MSAAGPAIVMTPAAAGGLGDQAMIDVAVTELSARGHDVVLSPNPTEVRGTARTLSPSGIGGKLRLLRLLIAAKRIIIIGADILDGGYDKRTILRRLRFADLARRFGARVRVIGCSFSETPDPEVVRVLKAATWLDILARDPVSKSRMEAALGRAVPLVADSAFLLRPEARSDVATATLDWMDGQKADGRRVLALNVSALVFSKLADGALERFAAAVADWLAGNADIAAVVVAHDRRGGKAGDRASCDRLFEALSARVPERCHYVREGIAAWDAKAIAGGLDMAFVCRMHFAIACLGRGVPPLCLVTMGKFEGLMQHFGLGGLTLDPAAAMEDTAVATALDRLKAGAADHRATIEAALPRVKEMSAKNYEFDD